MVVHSGCDLYQNVCKRQASFCLGPPDGAVFLVFCRNAVAAVSSGVIGFAVSGILFGISHGLDFPAISALVPDVIPPRLLPKGSVLYLLSNDLPPILLPLILGAVPESVGMKGVLSGIGIAALVLWPFIYWVMWRHPKLHAQCGSGAHA